MRELWAGISLTVVALAAWAVWAFGVPFADRACHHDQAERLDRLASTVRDAVPEVGIEQRRDQCRYDADAQVIAETSDDLDPSTVIRRLVRAGWSPTGQENNYLAPSKRMYVHVFSSRGPSEGPTRIEIQDVGSRQPED
jgi:hypothetical protein